MTSPTARRLTALLMFAGIAPVPLLAQTKPESPCQSEAKLSKRVFASAKLTRESGQTYVEPAYESAILADDIDFSGVTIGDRAPPPSLDIRYRSTTVGDSIRWLTVNMPTVRRDGEALFPSYRYKFAYNGTEAWAPRGAKSLTTIPQLKTASDLRTDIVVIAESSGPQAIAPITLTFDKDDILKAERSGAAQVATLRSKLKAEQCYPEIVYSYSPTMGCFLTSAACGLVGLDDDCWELRTLRGFRDRWLARQPKGADEITAYYATAPAIAMRLEREPRALLRLYWTRIVPSALAVRLGMNRTAHRIYTSMMRDLQAA